MTVRHIYISAGHKYFGHKPGHSGGNISEEVFQVECVAGSGLRGDRFFDYRDDYKGQVTFFSIETYDWLSKTLQVFDKSPSVFRRNIIVGDVDLNEFIGQSFELQGITFKGVQEARPCFWMNEAFAPGAEKLLMGRGGLRAKVLTSGILKAQRHAERQTEIAPKSG